jgi:hypothetical protein
MHAAWGACEAAIRSKVTVRTVGGYPAGHGHHGLCASRPCRRCRGRWPCPAADRAVDLRRSNGRNATPAGRSDDWHRPATEGARLGRCKRRLEPTIDPAGLAARHALGHDTADVVHAIRRRPSEIRQLRQAVDPATRSSARSPRLAQTREMLPNGPATNTSKDCRQWVKNGRRRGRAFPPGGQFCGRPSPFASGSARAVTQAPACSTSGTLSSTPSNFSGELC